MNLEYIEGIVANDEIFFFYQDLEITLKNGDVIHCKCNGCSEQGIDVYLDSTWDTIFISNSCIKEIREMEIA